MADRHRGVTRSLSIPGATAGRPAGSLGSSADSPELIHFNQKAVFLMPCVARRCRPDGPAKLHRLSLRLMKR